MEAVLFIKMIDDAAVMRQQSSGEQFKGLHSGVN